MSATLNAGSFRSDDTLYAASRTLKSYLRSILMQKWGPTDPKVRFGSGAAEADVRFNPRKQTSSDTTSMSALGQSRPKAQQATALFAQLFGAGE